MPDFPPFAYFLHPTEDIIVVVKPYERGYWPAHTLKTVPVEDRARVVAEENAKLGIDAAIAQAMMHGSMFGWDTPGANPDVQRNYLYTPETCPSTHWNDGSDICADCGKDLQQ